MTSEVVRAYLSESFSSGGGSGLSVVGLEALTRLGTESLRTLRWRRQSRANASLLKFPANREINREFSPIRGSAALRDGKTGSNISCLRPNSLRTRTGNLLRPNRELKRAIREISAPIRELDFELIPDDSKARKDAISWSMKNHRRAFFRCFGSAPRLQAASVSRRDQGAQKNSSERKRPYSAWKKRQSASKWKGSMGDWHRRYGSTQRACCQGCQRQIPIGISATLPISVSGLFKNRPCATRLPALRLFAQTLACFKTERIAGPVVADRGERPLVRACAFWPPSHPARKTPRPCHRPPGPCGRG